ncbi:hypothetical protein AM493_00470 [Flavobacterium akiainvivens]|uniref:Lipoprotein n=1 Tax=Flavobacterium akiainvivens TaxID=1202724 RepID=A0A0M8MAL1_9FLAO|nr:hypothetical protein [Flavobacterium akiainvivens]KOS04684.1 hypothetical protein AM493_00470 [Flavobacterium akiainvivens]SFQ65041.1 hypothetical protein SAMN05444144_11228 [Flavobacterium akiainvivens]
MKKILLLFSAVGLLSLSSCNNDDNFDQDTIAEVFQTRRLNFTASGEFKNVVEFGTTIPDGDMILVYRLTDDPDTDLDVWQLIPRTLYFGEEEVDYDYNFTQNDVLLYMEANTDLSDPSFDPYTRNQIFRIVIIPGFLSSSRTSANAMEEFKDYNATMKKYGIKESDVKQISTK